MSALLPPSLNPLRRGLSAPSAVRLLTGLVALGACALFLACGPAPWPGGIHAFLGWSPTRVRIVSVPPESPAARAGLAPDDVLLAIDGTPVAGMSDTQVHARLGGEVGVPVRLRIARGTEELELSVPRSPYQRGVRR